MREVFKTEQEVFWASEFGDEYIERNKDKNLLASNVSFFSDIFRSANKINSIIEFGANIGMNLKAIKTLLPESYLAGVEINKKAVDILKKEEDVKVYHSSILNFKTEEKFDLVFTKGVLIHINPEELEKVYENMYNSSSKYICICEYYNPYPVEIEYRGYKNKLFKRDFAGEILDKYKDLELVDYKFLYKRDNNFIQDDITWFLIRKNG